MRQDARTQAPTGSGLTDLEVLALRMAAGGYVSGWLREWPLLRSAFESLGIVADPDAPLSVMRTLAKAALQALGAP
ncbi:MAG TPA: hypothetical protein VJU18_05310 [Vicinamibacteria bacterium]|nr:hypothetical protein [Vicinamibacteria bacterium]